MKKRTYLSAAQRAAVVDEYRGGASAPVLAKKHNVSTGSIYAWVKLKPNGKKLPGPPQSAKQKRAGRRKVDPIAIAVDALWAANRNKIVERVRELVGIGVRGQLDTLMDAITKRVVAIS